VSPRVAALAFGSSTLQGVIACIGKQTITSVVAGDHFNLIARRVEIRSQLKLVTQITEQATLTGSTVRRELWREFKVVATCKQLTVVVKGGLAPARAARTIRRGAMPQRMHEHVAIAGFALQLGGAGRMRRRPAF
jgi:hypothetical protein